MSKNNKVILNIIIGIISPGIFFIIHYAGLYVFTGTFIKDSSDVFEVVISWYFMHGLLFIGTVGIPLGLFLLINKKYNGFNWIIFLIFGFSSVYLLCCYPF